MLGLATGVSNTAYQWQPTFVGTLQIWLRNNVGVAVGQWDDSSGNANHATQGTSGDQAELSGGGLLFKSSEEDHYDFGTQVDISSQEGFTLFFVVNRSNESANSTLLGTNSNAHFYGFKNNNDAIDIRLGSTTTTVTPSTANLFAKDVNFILTLQREAGGTGNINLYKNGTLLGQDSQATNTGDGEFISLGVKSNNRWFAGYIYEFLFYDGGDLTSSELSNVHNYLKNKHGL